MEHTVWNDDLTSKLRLDVAIRPAGNSYDFFRTLEGQLHPFTLHLRQKAVGCTCFLSPPLAKRIVSVCTGMVFTSWN